MKFNVGDRVVYDASSYSVYNKRFKDLEGCVLGSFYTAHGLTRYVVYFRALDERIICEEEEELALKLRTELEEYFQKTGVTMHKVVDGQKTQTVLKVVLKDN